METGAAPPRVTRSAVYPSIAAKQASSGVGAGAVSVKGIGSLPRRALGEVASLSANRHTQPPPPGLKLKRATAEAGEERLKRQRVSADRLSKGVAVCAEPDVSSTTSSTTVELKPSIPSRQQRHPISSAQMAVNARAAVVSRAKLNGTASQLAAARTSTVNAYGLASVRANVNTNTASMALRSRNIAVHTASRPAWNQNPAVVSTVQKSAIVAHVQSVPIAKPVSVAPPPKSVLKPALKHSGKIARGGKDKHVTIKALVDTESPCSSLHVTAHNTQRFMAPGAHNHAHAMDLDMSHAHTQSICEDEHALMPNPVVRDEPATASSHRAVGPTDADPMLLSEYAEEIFEYMKLMETKTTPNPNYMTNQPHLTWEMRSLLVDWLHSLHTRLHLLPETLFLAVNLMDRFMSLKQGVGRDKFQLVGLTCLQVACKYEEVMVPSVAVLVHMVQGGYSAEEVLKAERFVLGMIGFGVGYNGPVPFLKRVLAVDARGVGEDRDAAREVSKVSLLARYFCEVVLLDPAFVGAVPSMVATAAVFLGRKMLEVGSWTPQHEESSGFSEEQLFNCAKAMYSSVSQVTVEAAVYIKYSSNKFAHVAAFVKNFVSSNVVN